MYVKAAHFCVWVLVCLFEGLVGCPMVGGLCVWIRNPLFDMMSRMIFIPHHCIHLSVSGMCLICCVEISRLRICVGLGGLRSTG